MNTDFFCCRCGAAHLGKVKTSLFGIRIFRCGACDDKNRFPPSSAFHQWCWGILIFFAAAAISMFKQGGFPLPGGLAVFAFLCIDQAAAARRKVTRAREFHRNQGRLISGLALVFLLSFGGTARCQAQSAETQSRIIREAIQASVARAAITERVINLRTALTVAEADQAELISRQLYIIYEAAVKRGSSDGLRQVREANDERQQRMWEAYARRQELESLARMFGGRVIIVQ